MVTLLAPVFAVAWGSKFLDEVIVPGMLAGAVLVFVSRRVVFEIRLPRSAAQRLAPVGQKGDA